MASAGELGPESYKPNKHGGRGGAAEESKIIMFIVIATITIIVIYYICIAIITIKPMVAIIEQLKKVK